jgi:cytochrome c oxidase subunit 2
MNDWFARNILGMPEPAALGAKPIDDLIVWVHYLMLVLFVGWIAYFFYVLWRFNARRQARADHDGSKSSMPKYIELGVVLAEVVLLVGIAIPLWGKNVLQFPDPQNAVLVQVQAQQFGWNFRYAGPDHKFGQQDMKTISNSNIFGVDTNDPAGNDDVQFLNGNLHVVVNKPVLIYLSSKDVIHSFKVVSMRVTQDAIPGLRIPITFTPTKLGRYQIECAQLCGGGHSSMAGGFVLVETQEDFDKWFKAQRTVAGTTQSFE